MPVGVRVASQTRSSRMSRPGHVSSRRRFREITYACCALQALVVVYYKKQRRKVWRSTRLHGSMGMHYVRMYGKNTIAPKRCNIRMYGDGCTVQRLTEGFRLSDPSCALSRAWSYRKQTCILGILDEGVQMASTSLRLRFPLCNQLLEVESRVFRVGDD